MESVPATRRTLQKPKTRNSRWLHWGRSLVACALAGGVLLPALAALPAAAATPCTTTCTIWDPTTQPGNPPFFDESGSRQTGVELGLQFTSDDYGLVTGVRFFKNVLETGTHLGHLWSNTGTLLSSATFTESASGWQQASFPAPVQISPNTPYWISYFAPDSRYVATTGWPYPTDATPLHGTGAGFHYTGPPGAFPDMASMNNANYWVDVVFQPGISDLSITNSVSPKTLFLIGDFTYTLVVANAGPSTANNVVVVDPLPQGLRYDGASASQGSCSAGQTVTCSLGSLAVGAHATITIKAEPLALIAAKYTNTATVSGSGFDPNTSNNSASATSSVFLNLL